MIGRTILFNQGIYETNYIKFNVLIKTTVLHDNMTTQNYLHYFVIKCSDYCSDRKFKFTYMTFVIYIYIYIYIYLYIIS